MEPVFDTWSPKKDAGVWVMFVDVDEPPNVWLRRAVADAIGALASLGDPTGAELITDAPGKPIRVDAQKLLGAIESAAVALHSVAVTLDLHVHARTRESPDEPALAKLPKGALLEVSVDDEGGRIELLVEHTLFCPKSPEGHDNSELAAKNGPRLAKALQALAARFGPVEDFEGLPGIYEHGYRSVGSVVD